MGESASTSAPVPAGAIVGLLADDDRRRCFAALVLGATSLESVVAATGLDATRAGRALGRLAGGGIVESSDAGLSVAADVLQSSARDALRRPESAEHDDQSDEVRKILRNFVVDGRITQIPTAPAKRQVVLDWLAQEFEPGRRYSEAMVNLILGKRHQDTAALRRYLVDAGLLDRAAGQYWRSGGTVVP